MKYKIIEHEAILLAGMSFFGDPFASSDAWSEENHIGQLWKRLMKYLEHQKHTLEWNSHRGPYYEVHLFNPATETQGHFEIFVGYRISEITKLPYELTAKYLPPTRYVVFTLKGKAIIGDWEREILTWLEKNNYREAYPYNFQFYDERYKGLDPVDESVIDVYFPIVEV